MKILAADDERLALSLLESAIKEAQPDAEVKTYLYQSELTADIDSGLAPEVAFLDIEMPGMNGMDLAKYIKQKTPDTAIIFVTGYTEYAFQAYQMHASGYIAKPVSSAKVREELDIIKKSGIPKTSAKNIRVQCFGNFEIFVDDKPLVLSRRKSKELIAFLVDRRGSAVNMAEISSVLWDDGLYDASRNSQIHNYLTDISRAFKNAGSEDILLKKRNRIAVNINSFTCDYYDYLKGDTAGISAYNGEYMMQYSWPEFTMGKLERKRK